MDGDRIRRMCEVADSSAFDVFGVIAKIIDGIGSDDFIKKVLLRRYTDDGHPRHNNQKDIANYVLLVAVDDPTNGAEWLRKAIAPFSQAQEYRDLLYDAYYGGVIWGALKFLVWLNGTSAASFFSPRGPLFLDKKEHMTRQDACAEIIAKAVVTIPFISQVSRYEVNDEIGVLAKFVVKRQIGGSKKLVGSLIKELSSIDHPTHATLEIVKEIGYGVSGQDPCPPKDCLIAWLKAFPASYNPD